MTEHEKLSIVTDKGLEWKEKYGAAQAELESDRTKCADFVTALDKALDSRFWLTEGRGSYAWDDDRYRDEFRDASIALRAILTPMRGMAQNLASRLPTTDAVMKARLDLVARAEKAEAERDALAARVAELEGALGDLREAMERAKASVWDGHYGKGITVDYARAVDKEISEATSKADKALARTPAQSLAACKAAALSAMAKKICEGTEHPVALAVVHLIQTEASRLEEEAANG